MSCGRGTDRHSHWYVHGYRHHICASTSTEDEHRSTRTVQPAKYRGECLLLTPDKPARRVGLVYLDRVLDGVCRSRCRGIVSSAPAAHMRGSCAAGFPAVGWGTLGYRANAPTSCHRRHCKLHRNNTPRCCIYRQIEKFETVRPAVNSPVVIETSTIDLRVVRYSPCILSWPRTVVWSLMKIVVGWAALYRFEDVCRQTDIQP